MPASLYTRHAAKRSQQRGIPSLVTDWLLDYGNQIFDGSGGVITYFTRQSIRHMAGEIGLTPLRRMSEYLRCYLVQGSRDGAVITVGKRHANKHIWRN